MKLSGSLTTKCGSGNLTRRYRAFKSYQYLLSLLSFEGEIQKDKNSRSEKALRALPEAFVCELCVCLKGLRQARVFSILKETGENYPCDFKPRLAEQVHCRMQLYRLLE